MGSQAKRRRLRGRTLKHLRSRQKPTLSTLPIETLHNILCWMETATLKSARFVSKHFAAAAAVHLFRRITLVPDSKCLQNALNMVSTVLTDSVEEIIYDNRWVLLPESIEEMISLSGDPDRIEQAMDRITESALWPKAKSYSEVAYLTKILSSLSKPLCLTVKEYSKEQKLTLNDLPPFYGWIREELKEVLDASKILLQSLEDRDVESKAPVAIAAAFTNNINRLKVDNYSWSQHFNADLGFGWDDQPSLLSRSLLSGVASHLRYFQIAFIDNPSWIGRTGIQFTPKRVTELGTFLSKMSDLEELVLTHNLSPHQGRVQLGLRAWKSPGARWSIFKLLFPTGTFYPRLKTLRLDFLTTEEKELVD